MANASATEKLLRLGRGAANLAHVSLAKLKPADQVQAWYGIAAGLYSGGAQRFVAERTKLAAKLQEPQLSHEAFARMWANRNLEAVRAGGQRKGGEIGILLGALDGLEATPAEIARGKELHLKCILAGAGAFGGGIGYSLCIKKLSAADQRLVQEYMKQAKSPAAAIGGALATAGEAIKDAAVAAAKGVAWLSSKLACNEIIQKVGAAALSSVGVPPQVTNEGSKLHCAAWEAANNSLNGGGKKSGPTPPPPQAQQAADALRRAGINPNVTIARPPSSNLIWWLLGGAGLLGVILIARRRKPGFGSGLDGFDAKPGRDEPSSRGAGARLPSEIKRAMREQGLDPDSSVDYDRFVKTVLKPDDYRVYKQSGAIQSLYG